MIDLASTMTALSGLTEAVKNIASTSDENKRLSQLNEFYQLLIPMQASLMSAQNDNSALLRDKDELESQLRKVKELARDKERYVLVRLEDGGHAYALKESESQGQAAHYLCPNCCENGKKSIFYAANNGHGFYGFVCPTCTTKTPARYRNPPDEKYASE